MSGLTAGVFVIGLMSMVPVQAQDRAQGSVPPPTAPMASGAPVTDNMFMLTAAQDGKAEVALAELAAKHATRADVKAYAEMLRGDHQKANTELTALASAKKVSLPADVSASQKTTMDKLSKATGAAFDRAYVTEMVTDHQKAVDLFTKAANSTDADVKAFATKTLPTLKMHLEDAKKLQK